MHSPWFSIHFHKREPIYDQSRNGTRQHLRVYGDADFRSPLLHQPQHYVREHCSLGQISSSTINSICKTKKALPGSWKIMFVQVIVHSHLVEGIGFERPTCPILANTPP